MLAIIQARTNSKRFNKKVLYKIYNKPIIAHVLSRVKKSKKISKIIVATSTKKTDDILVKYLKFKKISVFRGELSNVARRMSLACDAYSQQFFIRISADSPLIDYNLIDKAISIYKKNRFKKIDLITNVFPKKFPKGQSVEIINNQSLKKILNSMTHNQKEHVTKYFYDNYKKFKIINFEPRVEIKNIKLSIDNKSDLLNILKTYDKKQFKKFKI